MRFSLLGSGSKGNALLIEEGDTRLLVDCGFSTRELTGRLERRGLTPDQLTAVLVTHEHGDHAGGAYRIARRFGLPLWMTYGTRMATIRLAERSGMNESLVHRLRAGIMESFGGINVLPFAVPHDAREPVQFVFSGRHGRLGVLTDCGAETPHVAKQLQGVDALILEFNHDPEMLANSDYPPSTRERIAGRYGHLSNQQAIALLQGLDHPRLRLVVAAHLSESNNRPDYVHAALKGCGAARETRFVVACQAQGTDWLSLA